MDNKPKVSKEEYERHFKPAKHQLDFVGERKEFVDKMLGLNVLEKIAQRHQDESNGE